MVNQYLLTMPKAVYSGMGALDNLRTVVEGRYGKAAVFTDQGVKGAGILEIPVRILQESGAEVTFLDDLPSEPDCDEAERIMERFRRTGADIIVAIGGGSVMDIAKLASITADGNCTVRELIDNPAAGRKTVSTVMIPTTAGTGSEATKNSIVAVPEKHVKVGIVNEAMLPDYVILDGALLKNLPQKVAASTGIDAMAHAIECYTSNKANPFSNLFALEAAKLIFRNIEKACGDPEAEAEKTNMLLAAFYAGVAISSSGTTAVHALSYPLGGKYHIPHGTANAMLLLPVMLFNEPVCLKEFAEIYDAVAEGPEEGDEDWVCRTEKEKAAALLERMETIIKKLQIPESLGAFGIGRENLEELVEAGLDVKRLLVNNKREVTYEDARNLYLEIM